MWQIGQIHSGADPGDDMVPPIRPLTSPDCEGGSTDHNESCSPPTGGRVEAEWPRVLGCTTH